MRLHLPIAILACFAISANATPQNASTTNVALIPVDGELNEDQRRLLDAALRAELQVTGNRLLEENERLTHVRGARSLGLGCQVEASPACLTFVADVAGLSAIYVGSAENGRIRLARYDFANGEITRRLFSEADIPLPGASYVSSAQALLNALQPLPADVEERDSLVETQNTTTPPTKQADPSTSGVDSLGIDVQDFAITDEASDKDSAVTEATAGVDLSILDGASLSWSLGVGGAALLALGTTSWGFSQWVARTPLTSPVSGSKSVADRLQLIDTTETIGIAMMVSGALLSSVGGGLALWPETTPE